MLKPLGSRVLLEIPEEETTTASGLVLTGSAKEKPQTAKVVAVGDGELLEDGKRAPISVKVGDLVLYEKYSGTEITYEDKDYLVIKDADIVAIVE